MNQLAKKSLGQHWLTDINYLTAICQEANISQEDAVLEIGPGHGSLTQLLVNKAGQVMVVELDNKLADSLSHKVKADNLTVINNDILKFDLSILPQKYKLIGNIPYYITGQLIRYISESSNPPSLAVLLIQKEVAERLIALPGQHSLLSITTQYYWQVNLGIVIDAKMFNPPPKVDSQVIILTKQPKPLFHDLDPKVFFKLIKAGFSQKRKTLNNSLSKALKKDKVEVTKWLKSVDLDPNIRAQNLSLDDWFKLYKIIT